MYQVAVGNPVSVLHACRNLAGTGTVTGQQGAITALLRDPTTAVSVVPVTISEIGSTGYYNATFTPNLTGIWQLALTNPAGTDVGTYDYQINSYSGVVLADITSRDLTTLARVKERIGISHGNFDDVLESLITEVSNAVQDDLHRTIAETTWTHYLDGSGRALLVLPEGPLVSVSSVNEVTRYDAGSGARGETLTPLYAYQFMERGRLADLDTMNGSLERTDGGVFTRGVKNWKVVYVAGWDEIPPGIVHLATTWVCNVFLSREALWLTGKDLGEGQITLLSPKQLDEARERALQPYRTVPGYL